MFDPSQTKTVQGFIPFKQVNIVPSESGKPGDAQLVFELYMPTELARARQAHAPIHSERHADLIRLASCIQFTDSEIRPFSIDIESITEYASQTGPLFGTHAIESMRDWAYAATAALIAMRIQEYLNGSAPIAQVSALNQINKTLITCTANESRFTIYSVYLGASGDYAHSFKNLPIVRKIESESGYYYAFVSNSSHPTPMVAFNVLSFSHELTGDDFNVLRSFFQMDEATSNVALAHLKLDQAEASFYDIDPDADILHKNYPLDDSDKEALTALVQALVIAHLGNAHVDVFQGNESTGFLSFGNYLSWLWFDFSRKLRTVKIGYCEECGRAFSLAGHRGMKRLYCSEACKTNAKNERTRRQTTNMRQLFENGASVSDIANELKRPENIVREQLSKWTKLKHDLDEDIAAHGFDNSALLKRCAAEKLDLNKLLNAKRKKELQATLKRR